MSERVRIAAGRAAARLGIGATWGVVTFALGVGGAWLGIWLVEVSGISALIGVGPAVGVALAILVCRCARQRIQRLRLLLMVSDGVTATATVRQVDRFHLYGMPSRTIYTVWFTWTDAAGVQHVRERQYGFFGSGRQFEVDVPEGVRIPIHYPARRPNRFVADVPYVPTMADQFI